mmetsp:Transcript_11925/g.35717  ORF Transcript_11925/g.35717 Transcript_11925/m.35717 type:complete len:227 (+) Transcript_11925:405-1085(+)|eukprot:CAMPEP_0206136642 /NCGR_PEP_ID=MMETSP1473-20131121/1881_1 /ASSEMBLY_ACC=CAM_ASM_001109 /TAXON_ID=1461547 /ORGANISM="Stichococcus sp, Strain RCC1054" /LENGTH=226 /DNA_ID=CAMNT_0053529335 /DNA_START=375 /DNA_END=1055 /DNA_ORIENTATION=+
MPEVKRGPALSKEEACAIIDEERVDEFERLRWTPGYCLDPQSWDRMRELIEDGSEEALGTLGRTPGALVVYRKFRRKMLQQYVSIADYVMITKLDFSAETTEDGKIQAGHPPDEPDGRAHITFKPNDFPYHMDPGIEHHNLWSTRALSDDEVQQNIQKYRAGMDALYWKNPDSLASIPGVWHGHVLSRTKQQSLRAPETIQAREQSVDLKRAGNLEFRTCTGGSTD